MSIIDFFFNTGYEIDVIFVSIARDSCNITKSNWPHPTYVSLLIWNKTIFFRNIRVNLLFLCIIKRWMSLVCLIWCHVSKYINTDMDRLFLIINQKHSDWPGLTCTKYILSGKLLLFRKNVCDWLVIIFHPIKVFIESHNYLHVKQDGSIHCSSKHPLGILSVKKYYNK